MLYLKDPKTGEKSATLTIFYVGSFILLGKLLLSDIHIGSIKLGVFSGTDFGLAMAALGAVYKIKLFTKQDQSDILKASEDKNG